MTEFNTKNFTTSEEYINYFKQKHKLYYQNVKAKMDLDNEYRKSRFISVAVSKARKDIERFLDIIDDNNDLTDEKKLDIYEDIMHRILKVYKIKDKQKFFYFYDLLVTKYNDEKKK